MVEARQRRSELITAPVIAEDLADAIDLAITLSQPVYDCLYLALAIRQQTHEVTADSRFVAAVAATPALSGFVQLLAA